MEKKLEETRRRCAETAWRVQRTARICGVSPRHVYRIIAGDNENEEVFTTYMELHERDKCVMQEVEALVPFYPKNFKY